VYHYGSTANHELFLDSAINELVIVGLVFAPKAQSRHNLSSLPFIYVAQVLEAKSL
jgi:hypothetical protein